jgi:hypothetical protein
MSEMPHCVIWSRRARSQVRLLASARIREFNENLRKSEVRITESNPHDSGLRNLLGTVLSGFGTALKMQRTVAGCTIEVDKCIQ